MSEFSEIKYIETVPEYLEEIRQISPALKGQLTQEDKKKRGAEVFYRGEDEQYSSLCSSIYRKGLYDRSAENTILRRFSSYFHDAFRDKSAFEKLLAAQHYGLPTKLLDVTLNPLVALYFACLGSVNNDGCVHIFAVLEHMFVAYAQSDKLRIIANLSYIKDEDREAIDENSKDDTKFELMKGETEGIRNGVLDSDSNACGGKAYKHLLDELEKETGCYFNNIKRHHLRRAYFVQPIYSNPRIRAQEGGFLVSAFAQEYTKIQKSTADKPKSECADGKRYAKLLVKSEHKTKILKELDKLGINRRILFPEMENVAGYLKDKYRRENA